MKLTILGSGTSHGVPVIGCSCPTCLSEDPRDNRTNASLLIESSGQNILIDCGRDFRQQALRHQLERVDCILLTHTHFDHVAGIDDLRVFSRHGPPIPLFGSPAHLAYLKTYIYHYLFDPTIQRGAELELWRCFLAGRLPVRDPRPFGELRCWATSSGVAPTWATSRVPRRPCRSCTT
jgi:phosphoribosyl 1,2-cyclic phosphate phosphodiesterase